MQGYVAEWLAEPCHSYQSMAFEYVHTAAFSDHFFRDAEEVDTHENADRRKARLLSASGPGSCSYLGASVADDETRLSDEDMLAGMRTQLGMPELTALRMLSDLPAGRCIVCPCGKELYAEEVADHALGCQRVSADLFKGHRSKKVETGLAEVWTDAGHTVELYAQYAPDSDKRMDVTAYDVLDKHLKPKEARQPRNCRGGAAASAPVPQQELADPGPDDPGGGGGSAPALPANARPAHAATPRTQPAGPPPPPQKVTLHMDVAVVSATTDALISSTSKRRGQKAHTYAGGKIAKHAVEARPDSFLPAVVETYGYLDADFRRALHAAAESHTDQSATDAGLTEEERAILKGVQVNKYYRWISVALRRGVAANLRVAVGRIIRHTRSTQFADADGPQPADAGRSILRPRERPSVSALHVALGQHERAAHLHTILPAA